jgi:hypothetical protein
MEKQSELKNEVVGTYAFLEHMYDDGYFPNHLVDLCKDILVELCFEIERTHPKDLDALYELTHAATDKFNHLQDAFYENDSEIETVARECIGENVAFIAASYGFEDADVEELIGTRDW